MIFTSFNLIVLVVSIVVNVSFSCEKQIVVTESYEDPEELFGSYYKVFNHFMKKGLLEVITIDQLPLDEHEFTVIK